MMERGRSLRIMNIVGAVLFGLTAVLYLIIIFFPNGILSAFRFAPADMEIDTNVIMFMLLRTIKPIIFAVIGIIGFMRKNMSFGWGIGTAVGSSILWLFPTAGMQLYFTNIFAHLSGTEQFGYANMIDSAMNCFGSISQIGILLLFGSAVAEVYAVRKLQKI